MEYRNVNEAMEYHKKLYEELAKLPNYDGYVNIDKLKDHVLYDLLKIDRYIYNGCFLCDYARNYGRGTNVCNFCPVYNTFIGCLKHGEPYETILNIFTKASKRKKITRIETKILKKLFRRISKMELRKDFNGEGLKNE